MNITAAADRFLEGYGLANTSLVRCVEALSRIPSEDPYRLPGGFETYDMVCSAATPERAVRFLSEFTPPVVRHALVELDSSWTLCLNNSLPNCSFADDGPSLAQRTGTRVFRVVDSPGRVWRRGDLKEVMSYEARVFEEYGLDGTTTKVISAMDDGGRWKWFVSGPRYPVEDTFDYAAKKLKDRFTSANLRSLLQHLGVSVVTAEVLMASAKIALLKQPGEAKPTVTWEELDDPAYRYYQRGLGWLPHIQIHATSVIHDFERAVQINPAYEPKVRAHIEAAKKILSGSAR
jgi:hypothetical protein